MFKFQSYLRFHKTIGQVDAVVSFTELAIRELRRGWQNAGSPWAYLEDLSKELDVFVTHVDPDLLAQRNNQLHIVSLVQHFEAFLREIGDEHPSKSSWSTRKSEEPLLEYTWKHMTKEVAIPETIKTEWDLMEYYREARNRFLHDLTGGFCTSESEREFTLEGSWYANEEIQAGADRDTAAAG